MKSHLFFALKIFGIVSMSTASVNLFAIFYFMSSRNWRIILDANVYGEAYLEFSLVIASAICSIPVMCDYIILSCKKMKMKP